MVISIVKKIKQGRVIKSAGVKITKSKEGVGKDSMI